jgi:hypothetical protein
MRQERRDIPRITFVSDRSQSFDVRAYYQVARAIPYQETVSDMMWCFDTDAIS